MKNSTQEQIQGHGNNPHTISYSFANTFLDILKIKVNKLKYIMYFQQ
jgi:hypothetical protein